MRILIVEDEIRLAETLRDLLELERYTADICHDGESGAASNCQTVKLSKCQTVKMSKCQNVTSRKHPCPALSVKA